MGVLEWITAIALVVGIGMAGVTKLMANAVAVEDPGRRHRMSPGPEPALGGGRTGRHGSDRPVGPAAR